MASRADRRKSAGLTQAIRQQVQAVDPNLPLFGERTMEDLVSAHAAALYDAGSGTVYVLALLLESAFTGMACW